jgi:hypothetical protein
MGTGHGVKEGNKARTWCRDAREVGTYLLHTETQHPTTKRRQQLDKQQHQQQQPGRFRRFFVSQAKERVCK